MDFKDTRKDYTVYIFDRNGEMDIKQGRIVTDTSTPHMDYQNSTSMQMVCDVNIEIDGKTKTYIVPDNVSATVTPDNMVISTDIAPILREIESVRDRNMDIVRSAPDCEKKAKRCDELLEQHNPEIRKRKEDERRFSSIEKRMNSLQDDVNSKFDLILKELGNKKN